MRIINLLIFGLSLFAAGQSLRLFVLDRSSIRSTVFWTALWIGVGVFGLYPGLADYLMSFTMMESRTFFIFVVAVFILYRLQFKSSEQQELLQRRVTRLAQEVALLNGRIDAKGLDEGAAAAQTAPGKHAPEPAE